jgi:hypothetical protein
VLYRYGGIELRGPRWVVFGWYDHDDDDLGLDSTMKVTLTLEVRNPYTEDSEFGADDGRYSIVEVLVKSPSVNWTVLQRLSLPKLMKAGLASISGDFSIGKFDPDRGVYVVTPFLYRRELGVAAAWAYGRLIGEDPTRYVAEAFGIKRSTAAQRVARARNRDHLLPPTEQGAH